LSSQPAGSLQIFATVLFFLRIYLAVTNAIYPQNRNFSDYEKDLSDFTDSPFVLRYYAIVIADCKLFLY